MPIVTIGVLRVPCRTISALLPKFGLRHLLQLRPRYFHTELPYESSGAGVGEGDAGRISAEERKLFGMAPVGGWGPREEALENMGSTNELPDHIMDKITESITA
jgi:hypothetical protein